MATIEGTLTALDLADRKRAGDSSITSFRLWEHANHAAGGREVRQTLFRHSLIHAGCLLTAKGYPYKRCPMCHSALKR
jgi:hypothetical protein